MVFNPLPLPPNAYVQTAKTFQCSEMLNLGGLIIRTITSRHARLYAKTTTCKQYEKHTGAQVASYD